MKHKLLAVSAALTLALCTATPALAAIEVDVNKAVIDNANILSQQTEDYITDVSVSLQESCGAQIGVYTVDYIGNYTAEGYSYELFNAWGLGDADKDNGVLLLLIPGEDNYYVSRGAGIESQLPISTLSTILDEQLLEDWEAGNYDAGTKKTVAALADKLCRIYGVSLEPGTAAAAPGQERGGLGFFGTLLVLIAVILAVAAIISLFRPRRGPRGPYYTAPPPRSHVGSNLFWYGVGRASRPRRPPPPPPPRRSAPPPPRPPRGGFSGGGGSSRPGGGIGRSGGSRPGGSFRSGGGSSRGGGVGRR
ncbi:MAG: TPM domain-containing protein [Gemmiger sp.]